MKLYSSKPVRTLTVLLAGLLACSGCTNTAAPADSLAETLQESVTLEDDLGRSVTVKNPQRIAVLIGSFADLLCDAGGKERIVAAADDIRSFDLDLDAANLGEVKSINQETLLASDPDLVIASAKNESQKNLKSLLDEAGIPVVYYDVSSFEDYQRVLKQMVQITGDKQAWNEHGQKQADEIEQIVSTLPEKTVRVLALRQTGKGIKALGSENALLGEMLDQLGAENIAGDGGLDTLSMEYIARENPDQIYYVAQGKSLEAAQEMADELFSQPSWQMLDAVKNDQVHVLDARYYNLKPNAHWAKAMQDLKDLLYES